MRYFKLEENFSNWIGRNKILWLSIIFSIGLLVGLGSSLFLGNLQLGITFGLVYGTIFVAVDLSAWGSE